MTANKNIYMAVAAAQSEFGTVTKGATNPAFKSKYADLSDVAGVVIPTLSKHGVCVLHYLVKFGDDDAMRTEFVHGESETRVSCDVPLIVEKKNMQGMKSATTYAKRIGLESLSGIAPEDDDGNAAAAAAPPRQSQLNARDQIRPDQLAIRAAVDSLGNSESMDQLAAIWGDLPRDVQMQKPVIDAKDKAKARLANESVTEDKIPY